MLKENWRKEMISGEGHKEVFDLNKIESMTMNNFNKQPKNQQDTLMLPIKGSIGDGGDSVYSAGIQFQDAEMQKQGRPPKLSVSSRGN